MSLWVTSGHMRRKSPCPLYPPNSDRESGLPRMVMSALPPKADMRSANTDVCFGPKADISSLIRSHHRRALTPRLRKRRLARLGTVARAGAPPAPSVWPLLQYREAVGIVAHTGDSRDHLPAPEIDHPHCPARRSAGSKARPARDDSVASI